MSKNTRSAEFRKVDVDELDDEQYQDDPEEIADSDDCKVQQREQEIKKLMQSGSKVEALKLALKDPPVQNKDSNVVERNYAVVLDVLTGFSIGKKDKDSMQAGVEALSTDELDSLMKYIYRGFARPTENSCEKLLNWHEAAFAVGGLGSIIRVMSARKSV